MTKVNLEQEVTFVWLNKGSDQEPVNSATTPVLTLWRGLTKTGVVVTPATTSDAGIYSASFTVPAGYTIGDQLRVYAVTDQGKAFVWEAHVEHLIAGEVDQSAFTDAMAAKILAVPDNKLVTSATGEVIVDMSQPTPGGSSVGNQLDGTTVAAEEYGAT